MAPSPTFAQLEQAASHVIQLIRHTRGLENTRLVVIGDLAVRKYLPQSDYLASIDLLVSKCSSPGRVRKEILAHPKTSLTERSGDLFYKHPNGWEIQVKLIPDWLCPYLPDAARPVREGTAALPYVSLEDLLIFKLDACGLHENLASKQREAHVAAALLELAAEHSPLILEDDKMDRVEQALPDVVEFSLPQHDKSWWQRCLGKLPDKQRSPQEILSELAVHAFSPPSSPVAPTPTASTCCSPVSRSSSYMSASGSLHSPSSSISSISTPEKSKKPEEHTRPRKMSVTGGRHKRQTSTGGPVTKTTLDIVMRRLELERPASPGIAFTNGV
ncbi:hypothetical protein BGZ63DRAFT_394887 [Mariannaea sp. PMI_226]|nr:hypothetical protein BGZ63DRAFT_394887 [Mariannaea sp. PMI_226]